MYYVIAAASPEEAKSEDQIATFINRGTPLLQEQATATRQVSTLHPFNVS